METELQMARTSEKPFDSALQSARRDLSGAFPFPLFLCLVLALGLGASTVMAQGPPLAEKIPVAASIGPLGDFCRNVGGERVAVSVLMPPGGSPHVFEPTPQAVAQAMQARVFVYVGAGLDPFAERLVAAAEAASQVRVEAIAGMTLLADNPHVWLDPVLAQDICRRIAGALTEVDPAHRQFYQNNLSRYLEKLEALHQENSRRTAAFTVREFVSFHPSFTYFARRYGLREAGVIEAAPGREPTPGHIQNIVRAVPKYHVRVVFAEPQLSPRMAEVIAREAVVKVLMLDPLGGRPPYGDDYLRLMRYNLDMMEQAMK